MADVQPFRGVRYSPGTGDLSVLTSPPYDVISAGERERLESRHPRNVVRLIEPGGAAPEKYTQAATTLRAWIAEGTLARDASPALYVLEQRYRVRGSERIQRGVLGAVSLDEGSILPHEKTMAGPVADRLELMRTTRANLEPIICVYSGAEGPGRDAISAAVAGAPLAEFSSDDGVSSRLFSAGDPGAVAAVQASLRGIRLIIADGHHRHRTAQVYAGERRARDGAGPWDAMMIMLLDAEWAGPSVLPIHRLAQGLGAAAALERLRTAFEIEEAPVRDPEALEDELVGRREAARCYVMMDAGQAWWLTLADKEAAADAMPAGRSPEWRDLDVSVLQTLVFERLLGVTAAFAHSAAEAAGAVERGEASIAFLLAPTPFDAVRRIAEGGEAMPPKSTYFFPKPRSGVVIRLLDE